jgi:integrase
MTSLPEISPSDVYAKTQLLARNGYRFRLDDGLWRLSKDVVANPGRVQSLLDDQSAIGFTQVLAHFAVKYSARYTQNLCNFFFRFLQNTGSSEITAVALINYRSTLSKNDEHYLGYIRGFIKTWHELGYAGVPDGVIDLLDGWTLRGNDKGDVVKRMDPAQGPLTDAELLAFNESAVRAYELGDVSLFDFAVGLCLSHTGRRPIQISHLRVRDVCNTKDRKGDQVYLLRVPRAKERGSTFRGSFREFRITVELWTILAAQCDAVLTEVQTRLHVELQAVDAHELPLFPDPEAFEDISTPDELRSRLLGDHLHCQAQEITAAVKRISEVSQVSSERTGQPIILNARRFRYTLGTRAGREGAGVLVIAELLDHSDTQNASIYVKNVPENSAALDRAIGHLLVPYAQAFAGTLVDSEKDAKRGDDPNSQVRTQDGGLGTCGSHGFCSANVPVPCYTCHYYQPWLDGPHEIVLDELIAERERLYQITGVAKLAAANDRVIAAVAEVIVRCEARKAELYG